MRWRSRLLAWLALPIQTLSRRRRSIRLRLEPLEDRLTPAAANYGNLPLVFEANQGQSDAQVDYLAHGQGYGVFLSKSDAVLSLANADGGGNAVRMHLVGGDSAAAVEGLNK